MNTESNSVKIVIALTAQQFHKRLIEFFKQNPIPSRDELYQALVPSGCGNTAEPDKDRFPDGIWKYQFVSSDGIALMIKYHGPDMWVRKTRPSANSSLYFTAQIICGEQLFFGLTKESHKPITTKVNAENATKGKAPRDEAYHIPLRDDVSSSGTKDWAHSSKVPSAGGNKTASFVFYIDYNIFKYNKSNLHSRLLLYFLNLKTTTTSSKPVPGHKYPRL